MFKMLGAAVAAATLALAGSASAEKFVNGDFESGNVAFNSSYAYSPGNLSGQDTYALTTNPSLLDPAFNAFGDRTSGAGNMMATNGTGGVVWSQTAFVRRFTSYHVSFWVADLTDALGASAYWLPIGGTTFSSLQTFDKGLGPWRRVVTTWTSGNSELATFNLFVSGGQGSAQLAFDNFSLGVPEPTTWALLIVGFGLTGTALRRRRYARVIA